MAAANTRVAIGSFGLSTEKADADLADLIAVKLTTAPGFELVERRELDKALNETSMSVGGLTKAKDAIHVGALLRVDQFILGTTFPLNGTNYHCVRLVDGRSGIIRAINVFHDASLERLAWNIAHFATVEAERPAQGKRDYLAIGVIQNLGVNNRFSDFPAQMRGGIAANLSGKVTVLERDVISFLANEVRMNMAGLTESSGGTNSQMQLGFWIVDGFYQSYEVAKPEVQLKLRVERIQGGTQSFMLQSEPNEQFFTKISQTIENALKQPASADTNSPTKRAEIAALEERVSQLVDYRPLPQGITQQIEVRSSLNADKAQNTVNEAIRVYESILLLDPDNVPAKMRLAACLLSPMNGRPTVTVGDDRVPRLTDLYKEVISTGESKDSVDAKGCLAFLKAEIEGKWMESLNMLHQFAEETVDPNAKRILHFYAYTLLTRREVGPLPIEKLVPHVRDRLFDYLAYVEQRTNEPFIVSFDGWVDGFMYVDNTKVLNAVLPDLLKKSPRLKPHILLAAVCEQKETNSPVVAQFLESLKECEEHPETVVQPASYFTHLSTTLQDEEYARLYRQYAKVYEKTFHRSNYTAVVAMALARQRASEKGLAPPLTDHGKDLLAQSYGLLGQWQQALDVYNTLPNVPQQVLNECRQHLGVPPVSKGVSEWENKPDVNKVAIAYNYMKNKDWLTAAAVLDSIGNRTVEMHRPGPWGWSSLVLPPVVANQCRVQAGKPPVKDPMIFELGEVPYIHFTREATRFDFQTEGEDVWVGIFSRIERFTGPGPLDSLKPIEMHDFQRVTKTISTCICVSPQFIWLGTDGDGLFEWDRKSGMARHFTSKNGLLLDGISGLCLQDKTLWIAYRNVDSGGVGTLDLQTHKFSARTANLDPNAGNHSEPSYAQGLMERPDQPPQLPIAGLASGASGEMWFGVNGKGIQCYQDADNRWTTFSNFPPGMVVSSIAADVTHNQLLITSHDSFISLNEKSSQGGLCIYNYRENRNDLLQISQGLPANETTAVAVDGNIAWVGGRGFVAVVDIVKRKVLRIAYISANKIRTIALGKRYAWVHVYTNPNTAWADKTGPVRDMRDLDVKGEAETGIYRVDRSTVERID